MFFYQSFNTVQQWGVGLRTLNTLTRVYTSLAAVIIYLSNWDVRTSAIDSKTNPTYRATMHRQWKYTPYNLPEAELTVFTTHLWLQDSLRNLDRDPLRDLKAEWYKILIRFWKQKRVLGRVFKTATTVKYAKFVKKQNEGFTSYNIYEGVLGLTRPLVGLNTPTAKLAHLYSKLLNERLGLSWEGLAATDRADAYYTNLYFSLKECKSVFGSDDRLKFAYFQTKNPNTTEVEQHHLLPPRAFFGRRKVSTRKTLGAARGLMDTGQFDQFNHITIWEWPAGPLQTADYIPASAGPTVAGYASDLLYLQPLNTPTGFRESGVSAPNVDHLPSTSTAELLALVSGASDMLLDEVSDSSDSDGESEGGIPIPIPSFFTAGAEVYDESLAENVLTGVKQVEESWVLGLIPPVESDDEDLNDGPFNEVDNDVTYCGSSQEPWDCSEDEYSDTDPENPPGDESLLVAASRNSPYWTRQFLSTTGRRWQELGWGSDDENEGDCYYTADESDCEDFLSNADSDMEPAPDPSQIFISNVPYISEHDYDPNEFDGPDIGHMHISSGVAWIEVTGPVMLPDEDEIITWTADTDSEDSEDLSDVEGNGEGDLLTQFNSGILTYDEFLNLAACDDESEEDELLHTHTVLWSMRYLNPGVTIFPHPQPTDLLLHDSSFESSEGGDEALTAWALQQLFLTLMTTPSFTIDGRLGKIFGPQTVSGEDHYATGVGVRWLPITWAPHLQPTQPNFWSVRTLFRAVMRSDADSSLHLPVTSYAGQFTPEILSETTFEVAWRSFPDVLLPEEGTDSDSSEEELDDPRPDVAFTQSGLVVESHLTYQEGFEVVDHLWDLNSEGGDSQEEGVEVQIPNLIARSSTNSLLSELTREVEEPLDGLFSPAVFATPARELFNLRGLWQLNHRHVPHIPGVRVPRATHTPAIHYISPQSEPLTQQSWVRALLENTYVPKHKPPVTIHTPLEQLKWARGVLKNNTKLAWSQYRLYYKAKERVSFSVISIYNKIHRLVSDLPAGMRRNLQAGAFSLAIFRLLVFKEVNLWTEHLQHWYQKHSYKAHKRIFYTLRRTLRGVFRTSVHTMRFMGLYFQLKGKVNSKGGLRKRLFRAFHGRFGSSTLRTVFQYKFKQVWCRTGAIGLKTITMHRNFQYVRKTAVANHLTKGKYVYSSKRLFGNVNKPSQTAEWEMGAR